MDTESVAPSKEIGVEGRIRALDAITSSSIRKGQIVSKVSDIVRELVENAIDAGASIIQVYLEKFGKDKIEIKDNGHGIRQSDITQIFQGGATSKLQGNSNLSRENFLGFRGEALSAICAAGNVTVTTKCSDDAAGTCFKLDFAGNIVSQTKLAAKNGTTITVEKLFDKIYVRRQRLDNPTVGNNEIKEIEAYLKGVGIINHKCHVSFYHNTSSIWSKASVQTLEQSLYAVLGHSIAKKLKRCGPINFEGDEESITLADAKRSIEMYLPVKPVDMRTMSYTSNKMALIFCNRKRVYIRELEKLIHSYVVANVERSIPSDQRRFPVSVLCIEVPSSEVDFNLDMDKAKVLLVQKDKILDLVEAELVKFYGTDLRRKNEPTKNSISEKPALSESISSIELEVEDSYNSDSGLSNKIAFDHAYLKKKASEGDFTSLQKPKPVINTDKDKASLIVADDLPPPPVAPVASDISHTTATRQSTINDFLQSIPSTSQAFVRSPMKPMDSQPISVQFPQSKPTVDIQPAKSVDSEHSVSLKKSTGGNVVSNFQINIDSQELLDDEVLLEEALPAELVKIPTNPANYDDTSDEIQVPVNKLTNWLEGRMTDKFGEKIEAVEMVRTNGQSEQSFSTSFNGDRPGRSPYPSKCSMEPPPTKRARHDDISLCPPAFSPVVPFATPNTPRMTPPRQITLDSMSNWSNSSTSFSQSTSKAVTGVRIPFTPKRSTSKENTSPGSLPEVPASVLQWESQQREHSVVNPSPSFNINSVSRLQELHYSPAARRRVHPRVHKALQGSHVYAAQTHDSIGVFFPENMLKYFPEEAAGYYSSGSSDEVFESSQQVLSFEDVSNLFQRFISIPNVNYTPVGGKVFHVLSQIPDPV